MFIVLLQRKCDSDKGKVMAEAARRRRGRKAREGGARETGKEEEGQGETAEAHGGVCLQAEAVHAESHGDGSVSCQFRFTATSFYFS